MCDAQGHFPAAASTVLMVSLLAWAKTHAVVFLEGADDGLDRSPPFELAPDLRRDAALLAAKFTLFSIDFFLQKAPATSV